MPGKVADQLLNFDIDRYINPFIPHNRLSYLPTPISRWLGYRKDGQEEPAVIYRWISTFIGSFVGILLVGAVYKYGPGIASHKPPVIIASLGATAVLDYNSMKSPLAQPRNAFFGQTLSAIVAVGISKLFQLNPNFVNIEWIAGAMACAVASVLMSMTNTVHPPGGATAVLAATQPTIIAMGWWFVPTIMVGTLIMFGVALIVNNVQRQYPIYWWTSQQVGSQLRQSKKEEQEREAAKAAEKSKGRAGSTTSRYVLRTLTWTSHRALIISIVSAHLDKMQRGMLSHFSPVRMTSSSPRSSCSCRSMSASHQRRHHYLMVSESVCR
jgi:hypothetical protein